MPLDPSIILGVQNPQFANPVDLQNKVYQNQMLGMQNQNMQHEFQNQQAMRDAYKNNMTIGTDGTPSINRSGLVSQLAQQDPMLAMKTGQELGQNQLAMQQQQTKQYADQLALRKQLLATVPTGNEASPEEKQAAWTQMKANSLRFNIPGSENLPDQDPGDGFRKVLATHLKTSEEQDTQRNKLTDQTTERAKANASLAEAGLPTLPAIGAAPGQGGGTAAPGNPTGTGGFSPPPKMRQKAMDDYTNSVAGSRQQPDALQALKDIQAGQKLSEITKLAPGGDLNKLNNQQTKLAITELVKMAGGTSPTEGELDQMTPDNLVQKYSGLLQKWTNKSQPANAGEFIQQGIDYANGIQKLGAQKLNDRSSELVDRQRDYLGEKQYKMVKGQIADEFSRNSPQEAAPKKDKNVMSFEDWRASQAGGKK